MNRKQFFLLLGLVAVLGAAGWIIRQRAQQSWHSAGQAIGQKLLPDFPVNDLAQVTIQSGTNELHLVRRDNVWSVAERGNYPANFSQIRELLLKFADLKITQVEDIGPSQLGRLDLLPPGAGAHTGTQVEFKDANDKVRATVLLGKTHLRQPASGSQFGGAGDEGWPDGRYVKTPDAKAVALISDALDSVQPQPQSWLDKDFFSIDKPRSIAVQFPEITNSWQLTRGSETNDWQLADARPTEKLDVAKVAGVAGALSSPTFDDVVKAGPAATNVTTVTIKTFDEFTYVAQIGNAANGDRSLTLALSAALPAARVPAGDEKPEDKIRLDNEFKAEQAKLNDKLAAEKKFAGWTFTIPSYVCEPLLKFRSDLLSTVSTNTPAPSP